MPTGPTNPLPGIRNEISVPQHPTLLVQIHNIEIRPGKGGQMVRAAGTSATLVSKGALQNMRRILGPGRPSTCSNCRKSAMLKSAAVSRRWSQVHGVHTVAERTLL